MISYTVAMRCLFIGALVSCGLLASAQDTIFSQAYYSDSSYTSCAIDNANNVYAFGNRPGSTKIGLILTRYNGNGVEAWHKIPYFSPDFDAVDVQLDSSGTPYFYFRQYDSTVASAAVLEKRSAATGEIVWAKTYTGGSKARPDGLCIDNADRVYRGATVDYNLVVPVAHIDLFNAAGDPAGSASWNLGTHNRIIDMVARPEGGAFVLTGTDPNLTTVSYAQLTYITPAGAIGWQVIVGYAIKIAYTPYAGGQIYCAGRVVDNKYRLSRVAFSTGAVAYSRDILTPNGNYCRVRSLAADADGGSYLAGANSANGGAMWHPYKAAFTGLSFATNWEVDSALANGESMSVAVDKFGTVRYADIWDANYGILWSVDAISGIDMGENDFNGSPTFPQEVRVNSSGFAAYVGRFHSNTLSLWGGFARLVGQRGLKNVTLPLTSYVGGQDVTATVRLYRTEPTSKTVFLSGNTYATVPASVVITSGSLSSTFNVHLMPTALDRMVTVTASLAGVQRTFNFVVKAPTPSNLMLVPNWLHGGANSNGAVTINGTAPTGGIACALSSGSGTSVPPFATIPAGGTTRAFTVNTSPTSVTITRTVSATYLGVTRTSTLTIVP